MVRVDTTSVLGSVLPICFISDRVDRSCWVFDLERDITVRKYMNDRDILILMIGWILGLISGFVCLKIAIWKVRRELDSRK